jgi:hypothetical protein
VVGDAAGGGELRRVDRGRQASEVAHVCCMHAAARS